MMDFEKELTNLLNIHGFDSEFNTPDFILAEYLINCLKSYQYIKKRNDDWHSYSEHRRKLDESKKILKAMGVEIGEMIEEERQREKK